MIIKLIDAKEKTQSAPRYVRNLSAYMADPDPRRLQPDAVGMDYGLTLAAYMTRTPEPKEAPRERVLYKGALASGQAQEWDDGLAELERRIARRSARVKKPARHVVLSYRRGENPTEQDCADAVAILAEELGCDDVAIAWAAHADTDNVHIHALFVTIDAATGEALPFGQGPSGRALHKEAMQRAIARIEDRQNLQPEVGARYEVVDDHVVRKADRPAKARSRAPLRQEILAFEEASGFASFTRVAQEIAGPILDAAGCWADLHRELAPHGIGIRPAGNGGELYADGGHVKLSNVDRAQSWSRLVKPGRLGPYEEPVGVILGEYQPRVLDHDKAARWHDGQDTQRAIGKRIDGRVASLMAARDAVLSETRTSIAAHRADVVGFDGDPRLVRDLGGAWQRLHASVSTAIGQAFATRIDAVRALRHAAAGSDDVSMVDLAAIGTPDIGIAAPWFSDHGPPSPMPLAGFEAERRGDAVRYWDMDDPDRRRPALVEAGAIIWVNDRSDRAVEAALLLAQQRFGGIAVFGDVAYLEQCDRGAKRLGIELEVISVREAVRRARKSDSPRDSARRRVVDGIIRERLDSRRAWARAYERATPGEEGLESLLGELPHIRDLGRAAPIDPERPRESRSVERAPSQQPDANRRAARLHLGRDGMV